MAMKMAGKNANYGGTSSTVNSGSVNSGSAVVSGGSLNSVTAGYVALLVFSIIALGLLNAAANR